MKKLNIIKTTIAPLLAAGVILLSGCSKEGKIDELITTDTSFTEVLDSVADETQLDENLEILGYQEDLESYSEARSKVDIEECNTALAKLGKKLIEASVCDHLGINIDEATGDIDINDRKLVEEKYYLGEEASDLAFNTYHAYMGHQDREEDLDEIFKAYQRYLLTTGESDRKF